MTEVDCRESRTPTATLGSMAQAATSSTDIGDTWPRALAGKFLVFEGPDGSGKSTQMKRLTEACEANGVRVTTVREPGGTSVGEQIRSVLLDPSSTMTLRCEMLLYMASRAQLVEQTVQPALAAGHLVIADRFLTSTYAYQGAGGGLAAEDIKAVGRVATLGFAPDLVLIYYVDVETATARTRGVPSMAGKKKAAAAEALRGVTLFDDRIEQRSDDFRRRVHESYLAQAKSDPAHHALIDAKGNAEQVWTLTVNVLSTRFAKA
ncbi:MAG: dTMP kinase [Phycisphaeraceae bacterium]|nr:dTMP kinase [Phycisphaeraceae bacterium]